MNMYNSNKPAEIMNNWFNSRFSNVKISLMRGKKQNSQETEIFAFISCMEIDSKTGNQTERSVTLKASMQDMLALKHAIKLVHAGEVNKVNRFAIASSPYAANNGSQKSLTVGETAHKETGERFVTLVFKQGDQDELAHVLDHVKAFSLVDCLNIMAENGYKLAIDDGVETIARNLVAR
ncbi:hypothetical protein Dalk_2613 [Desulfatibacillum aliphaticivorans]|uniref:Uncharacterized protein n=1 Tax=Desulfatibacillum aliphaticivorans TaxID=218208 RepID=B8FIR5_DESAL|nr:hypothetical protein [Desulfatibacillum aliphaticivorans]ACL04306.1 hypothetical protein Dalk_2613 [Desulfatibacillum aliphaticivorans]